MSNCSHPALFNSMCVSCGRTIKEKLKRELNSAQVIQGKDQFEKNSSSWLTMNGGKQLELSKDEAIRVQKNKLENLKKGRKLALILDLDHTLLHSIQVDGAAPKSIALSASDGINHLPIEDIVDGSVKHLIMKKRPHLDDFLFKANEFCQISIYTAATRRYAEAVAKIIDPQRRYFGDRIVSRSDVNTIGNRPDISDKSLARLFLGDTSLAVIIDDREDVWKGDQGMQLLQVRPYYHFFAGKEVNNNSGPKNFLSVMGTPAADTAAASPSPVISLASQSPPGKILKYAYPNTFEYSESDDQLLRCLDLLKEIHCRYYAPLDTPAKDCPNNLSNEAIESCVSTIITDIKHNILAGCVLTFSGVIPIGEPNPEGTFIWKLAVSLGAQVSTELSSDTTHLIAAQLQTQKVNECLLRGNVWILHPDWLMYCRWSLSKALETTFMLNSLGPGQSLPNPPMMNPSTSTATSRNRQDRPLLSPLHDPGGGSAPGTDRRLLNEKTKRRTRSEMEAVDSSLCGVSSSSCDGNSSTTIPLHCKKVTFVNDSSDSFDHSNQLNPASSNNKRTKTASREPSLHLPTTISIEGTAELNTVDPGLLLDEKIVGGFAGNIAPDLTTDDRVGDNSSDDVNEPEIDDEGSENEQYFEKFTEYSDLNRLQNESENTGNDSEDGPYSLQHQYNRKVQAFSKGIKDDEDVSSVISLESDEGFADFESIILQRG